MSDVTVTEETAPEAIAESEAAATGDFSTESTVAVTPREISDDPGAATGRRKRAVARAPPDRDATQDGCCDDRKHRRERGILKQIHQTCSTVRGTAFNSASACLNT